MEAKINVALIGYGYWGKILEKYLIQSNFNLQKIYCPSTEKKEKYTNDINDILNDKTIDAVILATPIDTHYNLCKLFIENNKHVFCEKPLVKNEKKALELLEFSLKKDKILETNYIYLDSPSIKQMKILLPKLGKIQHINGEISQFGNFYKNDDVFSVVGCHFFAIIFDFFHEKEIRISKKNILKDIKNNTIMGEVDFKFKRFDANFKFNLKSPSKERKLTIYGEKGILHFDMLSENTLQLILLDELVVLKTVNYSFDEENNLKQALFRFEDTIRKRRKDNLEISINVARILEAIKNGN